MIAAFRRIRQKLDGLVTSWAPAQDVTMLTLRPMPWELDRRGHPTRGLWTDIAALAARGWCADCGYFPDLAAGKPELQSQSAKARLRPFESLLVRTRFFAIGTGELLLYHELCTPAGEIMATFTTRLPLAELTPADPSTSTSTVAPIPADPVARAA
ncbi:hypothetical protein FF80_03906 [Devosia sp. LC5]|uniref:hypothetical protein n=1 Tax=Devosia sp. LC5 TaxID=1502724 RepID=UPI0004E30C45|nr:hypothetical protein [Devosia sp. LC5]KFC61710.1 hypothetical protein FF80_03906 [Devosia sp. LC5]